MSTGTNYTPNTIAGIDTLYYFYETNDLYDDLFLDILDQLDDTKARFEKRDIKYENKDLQILINKQTFIFNGKAQGFYWFTHIDNYLTIGFKDYKTNKSLNDIQVQFNAIGIYTIGLKALLKYTDDLLAGFITGHKPLTRVDLNIFVESDLSWIDKDMFVARKRSYTSIFKEVASKHKLQTLYIGKKPFLLRMYDKMEELKNSKKKNMMYEYFLNNGFKSLTNAFNIEFEMHRGYFKSFQIDTVDDLLSRAELLFQDCLSAIRLVDLSSITDNTVDEKNKHRASTHPLWEHLHSSYKLKDFLALDAPLERIKRKSYTYTIEEAIKEHIAIARKFYIHGGIVDKQHFDEVLEAFIKSKEAKYQKTEDELIQNKLEFIYEDVNQNINPRELDDIELQKYILKLFNNMDDSDLDEHVVTQKYQTAFVELKSRGITNPIVYPL
ncbi:MAG: hypothetical protein WC665_00305 [Sulfurimonas sp.]|jgi:hypothetical protein